MKIMHTTTAKSGGILVISPRRTNEETEAELEPVHLFTLCLDTFLEDRTLPSLKEIFTFSTFFPILYFNIRNLSTKP